MGGAGLGLETGLGLGKGVRGLGRRVWFRHKGNQRSNSYKCQPGLEMELGLGGGGEGLGKESMAQTRKGISD